MTKHHMKLAPFGVTQAPEAVVTEEGVPVGFLIPYRESGGLRDNLSAPVQDKLSWAMQMRSIVDKMQEVGVKHWDLKCASCVLQDDTVEVIDLANNGFSREWKHPERIDMMYSLAMTFVELFTGAGPPPSLDHINSEAAPPDCMLMITGALLSCGCHAEAERLMPRM